MAYGLVAISRATLVAVAFGLAQPRVVNAQIEFEDITVAAGVSGNAGESWGAAWGNLDADGFPEIFVSNHRNQGRLWRNDGGVFTDVSATADASDAFGPDSQFTEDTHAGVWADLNNDGKQDLALTVSTKSGYYLVNDGSGILTDQRSLLGLTLGHDNGSRMPVFFDANNDGRLDVKVVGNRETASNFFLQTGTGAFTLDNTLGMSCPIDGSWGQLIDINASGRLELVCADNSGTPARVIDFETGLAVTLPFTYIGKTRDTISGDFNNDQRQDMIHVLGGFRPNETVLADTFTAESHVNITGNGSRTITLDTPGNLLTELDAENWNFIIRGAGTLNDIYIGASGYHPPSFSLNLPPTGLNLGIQSPAGREGMFIGHDSGRWTVVVNNPDGFNDGYFLFDSTSPITAANMTPLIVGELPLTPVLQLNTADGLVDATAGSGLTEESCVTGLAADFDNDMDLDVFLGCRGGASNIANVVFENLGNGTFQKVLNHGGEGNIGAAVTAQAGTTETVVSADYDVDGFVDVFVTNGLNLVPSLTGGPSQLFRNKGNSNNWVQLDLIGTNSNRDAVGAKVYVSAGGVTQYREQNGGYHRWAQNHQRIHVGLGPNKKADITIVWPSGNVDAYNDVPAKVLYAATEGQGLAAFINRIDDTDGDGLTDDDENDIYGTDPGNPDTDSGGARDGTEVAAGTDPLDPADDAAALPDVWIEGASASEADGTIGFTLQLGAPSLDDISVTYATQDGTALDGVDYVGATGTATITTGSTSAIIEVQLIDNEIDDADRAFDLIISNPQNAAIGSPPTVTGTILDNDALALRISDVTVAEGEGAAVFTVDLLATSADVVTVDYSTVGVSATQNLDYVPVSGQLSFNPGDRTASISVDIVDDNDFEPDESFEVRLDNAVNASIADATGVATITDNEATLCGEPSLNGSVDRGTFLWKDCTGSGFWQLRVYGGGTPVGLIFTGSFEAAAGIPFFNGVLLEGTDVVATTATSLSYALIVYNVGIDGLEIQAAPNTCFTPDLPADQTVYLGEFKTPLVADNLDLSTGGACADITDTDGDGLTDAEEVVLGTNPLLADTDGDTINDGSEVNIYGTDPLLADTDGGGVSDGDEITTFGLNPLDPADDAGVIDTDGDGLSNAQEATLGTDPDLADSDGDGLSDGDEVTVYFTDPLLIDTDSSGVSDGDEVLIYGTDPLDPGDDAGVLDTDGDGLSNAEEDILGTDPARADTDEDGLGDGDEVNIYGTDALFADTDSGGVNDGDEISRDGTNPLNGADDIVPSGLATDWNMAPDGGLPQPQYPDTAGLSNEALLTAGEPAVSGSVGNPPLGTVVSLPSNLNPADGAQLLRTDFEADDFGAGAPLEFMKARSFTVDGWAYYDSQGGALFSLGDGFPGGVNQHIQIVLDAGNAQLQARLRGADEALNTVNIISLVNSAPAGQWFHYALVRSCPDGVCNSSGDSLTLYLNGQVAASANDTGGLIDPGNNDAIVLGGSQNLAGTGYDLGDGFFADSALEGALGRTRIWQEALSAEEVNSVYLQGYTYPLQITVNSGNPLHAHHNDVNLSPFLDDPVPVIVVGDANIDANDIDLQSLRFGPGNAEDSDGSVQVGQFAGDSSPDAAASFLMSESAIGCFDTDVELSGVTFAGQPVHAIEPISTDCDAQCHPD